MQVKCLRGSVRAPEFPHGLDWLNTDEALYLRDLHGKAVLLDFWTYGCINCIHILPQLKQLEELFNDSLAIIGVHSPKFYAERDTENLRQAVMRYDIRHPVVNDENHIIWQSYAVSAWPSSVLIDPDGRCVTKHSGEFEADSYAELILSVIRDSGARRKLNTSPLPIALEREKEAEQTLLYPSKILADAASDRLFIADTGHHRIAVTDFEGKIQNTIGSGRPGLADGDFETASFQFPQGMTLDGDFLYIADTWNHVIRRANLAKRKVEQIAGTGEQARLHRKGGPAMETALSSPWDVAFQEGVVYIAMAGSHQIWALDVNEGEIRRFAGSGREAVYDDVLERSALAQPSGLCIKDSVIYFADSESSAIRAANIQANWVETIIGEGLFEFGDRDGDSFDVRLQHCLGIACQDGLLYVADTYNNKIKLINPTDRSSQTLLGSGDAGKKDGQGFFAEFWEPGGVSLSEGKLYIADTNNHAIRIADISTGEVSTLRIFE